MRFSEAFGITTGARDDWFDPHLTVDTKLFIDPLLMIRAGGQWAMAHDELVKHFVSCYRLVAKAASPTSVSARTAVRMLKFPEPAEFCLGYTASGTSGAGSSSGLARQMADGIAVAIAAGLKVPEHIEEIGILNEGIGADRISDAACNVLKQRFVKYTQTVARRHGIQLDQHMLRNARVDVTNGRWVKEKTLLPTNPVTNGPVLLVPERILNELPTLNADDWFDSDLNEDIRGQMNLKVGEHAAKARIVQYAQRYPQRVRQWARQQTSRPDLAGYNFEADPLGVVNWDKEPVEYAQQHPLGDMKEPANQADLSRLIDEMINKFRHFIEDQRGWSLLHNDDGTEKPEEAAQLAFLGMAQHYLRLFNVELDREVELGRGPVDFKVSSGSKIRLLIEVKKAHNGKFWNGLSIQLPSYLQSDDATEGWYVALRYRDNKNSIKRMKELPAMVRQCAQATGKNIRYAAIDARPKKSASKQDP
ncbi:hypothetical protein [Jiangella alkaliphila]|uniref:Uncharacterized protein n=1 Tax=Jiangella alkaliphila TaxID=419479 RepID=A0A1H2L8V1_9ACTN|nr:hypothetical protein [Jiangella alkaliphila]SDU77008.1 hypothetical protein SAMN04488563_5388 [Jiangella alkaliphila]